MIGKMHARTVRIPINNISARTAVNHAHVLGHAVAVEVGRAEGVLCRRNEDISLVGQNV